MLVFLLCPIVRNKFGAPPPLCRWGALKGPGRLARQELPSGGPSFAIRGERLTRDRYI